MPGAAMNMRSIACSAAAFNSSNHALTWASVESHSFIRSRRLACKVDVSAQTSSATVRARDGRADVHRGVDHALARGPSRGATRHTACPAFGCVLGGNLSVVSFRYWRRTGARDPCRVLRAPDGCVGNRFGSTHPEKTSRAARSLRFARNSDGGTDPRGYGDYLCVAGTPAAGLTFVARLRGFGLSRG